MSDAKEPVSAPLRRLGVSLLTLGRIRLELFAIEAQEEKERIASLLLWAVLAALLAGFGLLMLLVLFTVALWDTNYRLLALGGGTVVLVAAAVVAVLKVKGLINQPASLFQSSIGELREDADALWRRPGP
ncbi:putative membrane protein YqjE [Pelomonas saccharophila]|uniref:Membrane protein YqjE n=1 Tax=Roseateles saccharophilus TaxID=304 RepID=A0ABU1YRJ5_ROSSA|nr:phage holin family protein [Roseateles saccharophilus]MDR7270831.1 putative membrane protein YqjE [Roseateles saccharophilus]